MRCYLEYVCMVIASLNHAESRGCLYQQTYTGWLLHAPGLSKLSLVVSKTKKININENKSSISSDEFDQVKLRSYSQGLVYPQCKTLRASFDFTSSCPVTFALWLWPLLITAPLLHLYYTFSAAASLCSIRASSEQVLKAQLKLSEHCWGGLCCRALRKLLRAELIPALLRLLAAQEGQVRGHTFHLEQVPQCEREGCTALSCHSFVSVHSLQGPGLPTLPAPLAAPPAESPPPEGLKWTAFPKASHSFLSTCREQEQLPSAVFSCLKTYQPYLISFSLDLKVHISFGLCL